LGASNFIYHIEYSDNTVSTTSSKHITTVAEVDCEASSTQILDMGAWLEHLITIEHLDFLCTSTTSDNQITCIFLELC
jgi:hypothetical protein